MNEFIKISTKFMKQMMLLICFCFVFVNNVSATVTYTINNPVSIEYPGRVNADGSLDYAFTVSDGKNFSEFGIPNSTNGTLGYSENKRILGGYNSQDIIFGVVDWVNPYRVYFVDDIKNVLYTDQLSQVDYATKGYSEYGSNPSSCPTCEVVRIGSLTTLNSKMSGLVDSEGDFIVAEGLKLIKFSQSTDFTKTTAITVSLDVQSQQLDDYISDFFIDGNSNYNILTTGTSLGGGTGYTIQHYVYSQAGTKLYSKVLKQVSAVGSYTGVSLLGIANSSNYSVNIVYGYKTTGSNVYLLSNNGTHDSDICPSFCQNITSMSGLEILNGYAYISSPSENKIYRYPTNISVTSGSGYSGSSSVYDVPYTLNYINNDITFGESTYHNNSDIQIKYNLRFNMNQTEYDLYSEDMTYKIRMYDPNNLVVDQKNLYVYCTGDYPYWDIFQLFGSYSCEGISVNLLDTTSGKSYFIDPPATGWLNGTYTIKMYESFNNVDAVLDTDTTNILNFSGYFGGNSNNIGGGGLTTISTTQGSSSKAGITMMQRLFDFMALPVFWGLVFILVALYYLRKSPQLILPVLFILINVEGVVGLLDPYANYIIIITWIIMAINFIFVQRKTTG